jgi:hypothetical protein
MNFPAFGVVYANGISGFSDFDPHQRRHDGDRYELNVMSSLYRTLYLCLARRFIFSQLP